jgi:hypothetical protein
MVQASDLKQRFQHISRTSFADTEELVELLFETEWIRILVVRNRKKPAEFSIEVELALPSRVIEPGKAQGDKAHEFVDRTIEHLKYLLQLEEVGLDLGVVSKDGIWSATATMSSAPSNSFFESLVPPT